MQHEIIKNGSEKSALITIEGTWLDLAMRQAIAPPAELFAMTSDLPLTQNFEEMRSLVRGRPAAE